MLVAPSGATGPRLSPATAAWAVAQPEGVTFVFRARGSDGGSAGGAGVRTSSASGADARVSGDDGDDDDGGAAASAAASAALRSPVAAAGISSGGGGIGRYRLSPSSSTAAQATAAAAATTATEATPARPPSAAIPPPAPQRPARPAAPRELYTPTVAPQRNRITRAGRAATAVTAAAAAAGLTATDRQRAQSSAAEHESILSPYGPPRGGLYDDIVWAGTALILAQWLLLMPPWSDGARWLGSWMGPMAPQRLLVWGSFVGVAGISVQLFRLSAVAKLQGALRPVCTRARASGAVLATFDVLEWFRYVMCTAAVPMLFLLLGTLWRRLPFKLLALATQGELVARLAIMTLQFVGFMVPMPLSGPPLLPLIGLRLIRPSGPQQQPLFWPSSSARQRRRIELLAAAATLLLGFDPALAQWHARVLEGGLIAVATMWVGAAGGGGGDQAVARDYGGSGGAATAPGSLLALCWRTIAIATDPNVLRGGGRAVLEAFGEVLTAAVGSVLAETEATAAVDAQDALQGLRRLLMGPGSGGSRRVAVLVDSPSPPSSSSEWEPEPAVWYEGVAGAAGSGVAAVSAPRPLPMGPYRRRVVARRAAGAAAAGEGSTPAPDAGPGTEAGARAAADGAVRTGRPSHETAFSPMILQPPRGPVTIQPVTVPRAATAASVTTPTSRPAAMDGPPRPSRGFGPGPRGTMLGGGSPTGRDAARRPQPGTVGAPASPVAARALVASASAARTSARPRGRAGAAAGAQPPFARASSCSATSSSSMPGMLPLDVGSRDGSASAARGSGGVGRRRAATSADGAVGSGGGRLNSGQPSSGSASPPELASPSESPAEFPSSGMELESDGASNVGGPIHTAPMHHG
ncbi:hypothetical protein GPECTOR_28g826 [Gonium pectorale]|uniref:Uncharacterized protein n=1 Tax=Gonium pectorale TaxID=33097 RepID=A0A150GF21_GONPE|nr:hypothetical protein GPECTOR_28g826 [Gonium pectorale]|eukprot:KXZ48418.1 hypothetical protein GPECTOR_28g826 [Gonium pectorale]